MRVCEACYNCGILMKQTDWLNYLANSVSVIKKINILKMLHAVVHGPHGSPSPTSEYEHSSIPATVRKIFNLSSPPLTKREQWAGTFEGILQVLSQPRTDCPGCYSLLTFSNFKPIICLIFSGLMFLSLLFLFSCLCCSHRATPYSS